ncbi:MAG: tetraacyldisaccharide 4'-kinase [Planctomycetes bacterium]|nr:tetraacyldisaccharide 4'-kinase [Planctomycetota bacterium]
MMGSALGGRSSDEFHAFLKQRVPNIPPICLIPFLHTLSFLYGGLIRLRNLLYHVGLLKRHSPGIPVVSIGNITVGGTGKTPLVILLARAALKKGFRPGVVARGYKGDTRGDRLLNDEGLLLLEKVPGLALDQDPDRLSAAKRLIKDRNVNLILMDDGFQHRKLNRDLDLVVLDALQPFGFGRVLPAGLLREPLSGLRRAHAFVLTRCDLATPERLNDIETILNRLAPGKPIFRTEHTPSRLRRIDDTCTGKPDDLKSEKIFLFSGIAHPRAFEETLVTLGAQVVGKAIYPDHYHYQRQDLQEIARKAAGCLAARVVTTSKDAVKAASLPGAESFWVLDIDLVFQKDEEAFWTLFFHVLK